MINFEKYTLINSSDGTGYNAILPDVLRQYESLVKINYRPDEYSTIANTIFFNILNIGRNIASRHDKGWELEREQLKSAQKLLDEALGIIMKLDKKQNEMREKAIIDYQKEREDA